MHSTIATFVVLLRASVQLAVSQGPPRLIRNAVTTSSAVAVYVNAAPIVSLSAPSNGATGTAPATFTVTATASDSDGIIAKVEFFTNGALFATDTTAPYNVALANLGPGTYALTARSTDNQGLVSALSSAAAVTVSGSGALSVTRTYVYDAHERLCKTIEPESGATIIDYDGAGNVAWSVQGSNLTSATCDRASVSDAIKVIRSYDARNRVLNVSTPGALADIVTTYYPDGAVASISASNPAAGPVLTQYSYNKRRMLMSESVEQASPSVLFTTSYTYNANGHLSSLRYPDLQVVDYAPDALGRPTQVGTYATGISYYPNGAIQQFTYGNGVVHTMTQNTRRLPARSRDVIGTTVVLDDTYDFDANGNVTDITDQAQGGLATRGMGYDELDRLTAAVAPGLWGNASFGYDGLDNLTSVDQGTRHYRYSYSTNRRLAQINDPNGVPQITLGYDAAGNVTNKNGQTLVFDASNRLNEVTGVQYYRYDGLGRRVQTTDQDGKYTFWQYSQAGQVLFASEARKSLNTAYIYLGNTQLAARHVAWGSGTVTIDYQHTDALGSPVAETNATGVVTARHSYTSYGEAYNAPVDGPGYTGHVMDAATGLTYMQQRYYDPMIGRFLSVDPVAADGNSGGNFNRYKYAANNPYRFTDPDGRTDRETREEIKEAKEERQKIDSRSVFKHPSARTDSAVIATRNTTGGGGRGAQPSVLGQLIMRMLGGSVATNANMKSTHPDRIDQDDANEIGVQSRTITAGGGTALASVPAAAPVIAETITATGIPANAATLKELIYAGCIALGCAQGGNPTGARVRQLERIQDARAGNLREARRDRYELPEPKP